MTTILSVDWDYFFPPLDAYNWDYFESRFNFDGAWQIRAFDVHPDNGRPAPLDHMPRKEYKTFWDTHCTLAWNGIPVYVAESHVDIMTPLTAMTDMLHVINFDAHHDCGYASRFSAPDHLCCGAWVRAVWREHKERFWRYDLVYPEWRRNHPEEFDVIPALQNIMSRHYGPFDPNSPMPKYIPDMIFVCRSGCWSPPWADYEWLDFLTRVRPSMPIQFLDQEARYMRTLTQQYALEMAFGGAGQDEKNT